MNIRTDLFLTYEDGRNIQRDPIALIFENLEHSEHYCNRLEWSLISQRSYKSFNIVCKENRKYTFDFLVETVKERCNVS